MFGGIGGGGSSSAMTLAQMAQTDMMIMEQRALAMSYYNQYGAYGGYGQYGYPPYPPPYMIPWRPFPPFPTFNQNIPDARIGWAPGFPLPRSARGYGIDLNGDGRYQRGVDAVLGFDKNNDGVLSREEIEETNKKMKAFRGDFDLNGDGIVTLWERIQGRAYQREMQKLDLNRDGVLDNWELQRANAKVAIDRNRDGKFGRDETYSINNFPTPYGRGSIGYIDPFFNYTQINHHRPPWFPPPWYGAGYGGGYGAYAYAYAG